MSVGFEVADSVFCFVSVVEGLGGVFGGVDAIDHGCFFFLCGPGSRTRCPVGIDGTLRGVAGEALLNQFDLVGVVSEETCDT